MTHRLWFSHRTQDHKLASISFSEPVCTDDLCLYTSDIVATERDFKNHVFSLLLSIDDKVVRPGENI